MARTQILVHSWGGGVGAEQGFRRLFASQTELTRDLVWSGAQAKDDKILVDRDRKGPESRTLATMLISRVGLRITLISVIISNLFSKLEDALIDVNRDIVLTVFLRDEEESLV